MKHREKLCDSRAFTEFAREHRSVSVFAMVAGEGGSPDRAWVQCHLCGETFEFWSSGTWVWARESDAQSDFVAYGKFAAI